ncbi:MAG: C1 family peptidase [Clostridium sp.]|nr:C1 family peptidase [Prevotella sp.]MCM1429747.1 C1 family peptidase [Clostridium sp.]MCM1476220.1 C1 family peptidase [Muribaculaceae bacterium]
MKKYPVALAMLMASPALFATYMEAPAQAEPEIVVPDSTGFKFTDVKIIKTTPVKDQNKSGTCWSFSGTSILEDEVMRHGGPELDLSEMFTVRQAYIDKAKKYIRMEGKINFAQGGGFPDVLAVVRDYGVVPEEAYSGLNYGEKKHAHYEMAYAMQGYLDGILRKGNKKLTSAWLPGFIGILDAYLGPVPETFTYNGKTYTPQSFAKFLGLNADDFVSITSYTHHPFYEKFALEIPDNWRWEESMNVPLNEMKEIVDNALENGYTVGWAADVSEPGFKWRYGYALIPAGKSEEDMDGTELSRWVQLSDADREKYATEINGPVKEVSVTQEMRQEAFDNTETTDDHGMTIIGYATDQEGNRYYKVKNSWDTNQLYGGFIYVSEPYFLDKTISVMVHKNAVPKNISKKFK